MADKTSVKFCEIKEAYIYSVDGEKTTVTNSIAGFAYFEDINKPFVSAVAIIADSGQNFIGTLPIQGGEKFEIKFEDVLQEQYTYEFVIHKVTGRKFTDKQQQYILGLISPEAVINEGVRISEVLEGSPDQIVKKILEEYLETDKAVFTETCKYKIKFFPDGKKAHVVIEQIAPKAVPQSSEVNGSEANKGESSTSGKSSLPKNTKKASGSAGYLFFENRDGFHFKSVDYYYSDGSDSFGGEGPVETYEVRITSEPNSDENRTSISSYNFTGEIDLFDQMRRGVYSTYMVYYNFSTGSYEEYTYNYADSFSNQAHLGSQEKLGKIQKQLSENPTRIVSAILDHETWFSGEGSGSNEEKDGGDGSNPFPDYQKQYMAQAFARYYMMDNQKLEITIPGNLELKVGDKIKVMLPNMVTGEERKNQKYDEENSGTYLISKIGHNIDIINSSAESQIELIRDTYGMKEYTSNVKS